MKQEEKDLLLRDLCGRLPYGIKVNVSYSKGCASSLRSKICSEGVSKMDTLIFWLFQEGEVHLKPYLFPQSSMTEEQKSEYNNLRSIGTDECGDITYFDTFESVDWCNKNYFDYRGLIPMGLAIDCTNLNIY